jgi:hypothetical protein
LEPPSVLIWQPGLLGATTYRDAIEVGNDDGTLYAIKDPWGLSEPCSPSGGEPLELPVNLDAYLAYVRNLPGFSVDATELEIGGYPAVHLSVTSDASIDCPGGVVIEWIARADAPGGITWHLGPGDADSLYLVALPAHVVLFQYLGPSVTTADELGVMGSITFIDALGDVP